MVTEAWVTRCNRPIIYDWVIISSLALDYLKKIKDIDGKDSNSGNKHDPVQVSASKKTGKVQNKHNYRQDIENIKKHLRFTPKKI